MQEYFEEIYIKYAQRLYLFIYAKCRNHEMAEDILQTAFLKAIENISSFRGDCEMFTWLCKIALNIYINEIKKDSRTCSLDALSEENNQTCMSVEAPDPIDLLAKKESLEELYRQIEQLPPRWQELVRLRLQDFSFREIAERLGRSENWAKGNYSRAKKRLAAALKKTTEP